MESVIAILATKSVAALIPYVKIGAEKFADEVGKDAAEKVKSLFSTLKTRFSGDRFASESLAHFEKEPDRYKPVLEDVIREKLVDDKKLVDELDKHLRDIGPTLMIIQRMKEAEEVTGLEAKEMREGNAKVVQEFDKGKKITGMKVETVGK